MRPPPATGDPSTSSWSTYAAAGGDRDGLPQGRDVLDQRPPGTVGTGDRARPFARHPLRLVQLRGNALLQDAAWPDDLPPSRPRRPPVRRLQDLSHGGPLRP